MKKKTLVKPLSSFLTNLSSEEKEFVKEEKKKYSLVVALKNKMKKLGLKR